MANPVVALVAEPAPLATEHTLLRWVAPLGRAVRLLPAAVDASRPPWPGREAPAHPR